MHFVSN